MSEPKFTPRRKKRNLLTDREKQTLQRRLVDDMTKRAQERRTRTTGAPNA